MTDQTSFTLRARSYLREIPIVFQTYGFFRRIQFEAQLLRETLMFKRGSGMGFDDLPVPPPKLRYRVHGQMSETSFLAQGERVSRDISSILSRHGSALKPHNKYLDFGCGCARVLRFLSAEHEEVRFSGTDIDPEAICWNQTFLKDMATWHVNSPNPPMSFADGEFDVIVSVSVFTHLDEALQIEWLKEIERILAPGRIAILTIHGDSVWKQYPKIREEMESKGFHFMRNYVGFWRFSGLPDFYQVTFHSKKYITDVWSRYFDIVAYEEDGIGGHQSAIVLRKKASL